jgi:membrane AbrB-like protein
LSKPKSPQGAKPTLRQACALIALSAAFAIPLELVHFPAAMLLGAMAAGVVVATRAGRLVIPTVPFALAQGLIGCLMARAIGPEILSEIGREWPVFLGGVCSVLVVSTALGLLLARWRILPGATAVWGSAPGAAAVMVLMSEGFGGDPRLVAFMQYVRVMLVAVVASIVAGLVGASGSVAPVVWFPAIHGVAFAETLAIAALSAVLGVRFKIPAGPLLISLLFGAALSVGGLVSFDLPPWLMAACYALVGWSIGLRFTREILAYAARAFPKIAAATLAFIALCGGIGWILHRLLGIDLLTAYLATSPGGADSVAIIAAGSHADLPFVVAMQTARFVLVMIAGPALVRLVVSRMRNSETVGS